MTATAIPVKTLGDLALDRLKTLTGVTVYRGEVPAQPPIIQTDGQDDSSRRVAPYVVLFPWVGTPTTEQDVADTAVDKDWGFQVTCVAGYSADCEYLAGRVDQLLYRWTPVLAGFAFGRAKPPAGYQPGNPRPDKTVTPPRFFVPLQYALTVTA